MRIVRYSIPRQLEQFSNYTFRDSGPATSRRGPIRAGHRQDMLSGKTFLSVGDRVPRATFAEGEAHA
jgi:hypothetical protein